MWLSPYAQGPTDLFRTTRTETAATAVSLVEFVDFYEVHDGHLLDDELSDTLASLDVDSLFGVEIHRDHLELATIVGVDETGRVGDGEPCFRAMPLRGCTKPA